MKDNRQTINEKLALIRRLTDDLGLSAVYPALEQALFSKRVGLVEKAARAWEGKPETFPVRRYHPRTRLLCALWCAADTASFYREKGISYETFRDTMSDISLRAVLFYEEHGTYGLSSSDAVWLRHHLSGKLFRLGQLQFQLFEMFSYELLEEGGYMTFCEEAKRRFPEGTPMLNVHVPARTLLTKKECDRSFSLAEAFFEQYFPEHRAQAYLCFSWLLYPKMRAILPENSNIVQFAARFSLIGKNGDCGEALHRIYGKRYRRKADYPQKTALQKCAYLHTDCLGEACGIKERFR